MWVSWEVQGSTGVEGTQEFHMSIRAGAGLNWVCSAVMVDPFEAQTRVRDRANV